MPIIRSRYPDNWDEIALRVKDAAKWCCSGCGKPCRKPGVEWLHFSFWLMTHHPEWFPLTAEGEEEKPQRFTLTVAHLDQNPQNNDPSNLKALCAPCHLKFDTPFRQANTHAKREWFGQLRLRRSLRNNLPGKFTAIFTEENTASSISVKSLIEIT